MTTIDGFAADDAENAMFSIYRTRDGGYQIMIEPNAIAPRLPIGRPFAAAETAKAWIDTESASWFTRFRRGG
jgi:hypothetical protein